MLITFNEHKSLKLCVSSSTSVGTKHFPSNTKILSTRAEVAGTVKYFLASCANRGNVPDLGSEDSRRQACGRYVSISSTASEFLLLVVEWFWFMKPNNFRRLVGGSAVEETLFEGGSTCGL